MSKHLMLLRHGKSDWDQGSESDFDRPLAARGKAAAQRMAELIASEEIEPELIITSPAIRAASTAKIVQAELGDPELVENEQLYEAELADLISVLRALPDECERVMLVGHNPGLEELAAELSGDNGIVLKTCTLVVLRFKAAVWADIEPASGKLDGVFNPRDVAS